MYLTSSYLSIFHYSKFSVTRFPSHFDKMALSNSETRSDQLALLTQIQTTLQVIQQDYRQLSAAVETINGRVNVLAGVKQVQDVSQDQGRVSNGDTGYIPQAGQGPEMSKSPANVPVSPSLSAMESLHEDHQNSLPPRRSIATARIILTTYPGQSGIDPLTMNWGHTDPMQRGPVVVSRSQSTIRRRNGMSLPAQIRYLALTASI